jgi:hypothetical protein
MAKITICIYFATKYELISCNARVTRLRYERKQLITTIACFRPPHMLFSYLSNRRYFFSYFSPRSVCASSVRNWKLRKWYTFLIHWDMRASVCNILLYTSPFIHTSMHGYFQFPPTSVVDNLKLKCLFVGPAMCVWEMWLLLFIICDHEWWRWRRRRKVN